MTCSQILSLVFTLTLFSSTAFAGKKEAEAASMIERAKQLSDIRAEGAPAFRLKLNFKAIKEEGSVLEGTYTEVWASKTQWRRETVVGDFRRTEVAAGQKRWLLESSKTLPERIGDLPAISEIGRFRPEAWKPEKIENRKLNGLSARCVETEPEVRAGFHVATSRDSGSVGEVSALCFDRSSGVLVAEIEPVHMVNGIGDTSCLFSDYQKFGDRVLARSYECVEDGHPRLEARIVELVAEPNPDPELFARPNGARESTRCPDPIRPPRVVHQAEPDTPVGSGVVAITMSIGIDGAPHGLSVVSSPNPKLEKAALEAVRQWRFRPATCDREPVEMKIAVEVATHIR
jgi:TonB family protein